MAASSEQASGHLRCFRLHVSAGRSKLRMSPKGLLLGKTCVLTGGGRGIGAAIATKFATEGAKIILVARSEDQLQRVCTSAFVTL